MAIANGAYQRKWFNENVDEMREVIERYFKEHPNKQNPPTLSGLARALGAARPHTLHQWCLNTSPGVEKVADATMDACIRICEQYETWGIQHNGNPAFIIFLMKNLGFTDKQELVLDTGLDGFLNTLNQAIKREEG